MCVACDTLIDVQEMKKAIRMDYYFGDDIEISPEVIAAVERRNNITGVGGGDIAGDEGPPDIGMARESTEDSTAEAIELIHEANIDVSTGPGGRSVVITPIGETIRVNPIGEAIDYLAGAVGLLVGGPYQIESCSAQRELF